MTLDLNAELEGRTEIVGPQWLEAEMIPTGGMSEVIKLLDAVAEGDSEAGERLFPLVYDELRRIAASKMAGERLDHTLQPTALVHEAYLRLAGPDGAEREWESRGHFFAAAAEAMRRILIDSARRKATEKRGGKNVRVTWDEGRFAAAMPPEEILMIDEALERLEAQHPDYSVIVKLHYFAGLTIDETAATVGLSASSADRKWKAARIWLFREVSKDQPPSPADSYESEKTEKN